MNGAELIAAERQRQIDVEGWTPEHDREHDAGELTKAAVSYAWPHLAPALWPWDFAGFKPTGGVRDLIRAGALIAAEIDRLITPVPHSVPPGTDPFADLHGGVNRASR